MQRLQNTINAIQMGNNGYSHFPLDDQLANDVRVAGFYVVTARDLHGRPCYCGFTEAGWKAWQAEQGLAPVRSSGRLEPNYELEPDYEQAILDRQEYLFAGL